ncbi:hypothetical protein [Longimicrobium sp.]|uniref:hypothetical protein n=1 Tax=Longimicrobium sp. TaxID=2029185 RepID=UPI002E2EEC14|nr:hypothetical protein [Longimicrobium sp.]HEX6040247.1 hypothetical protein [Longimicrobium sp.]
MRYRRLVLLHAASLLALSACAGGARPDDVPGPAYRAFRAQGGAIVVSGRELDGPSTSLITVLRSRIVSMQVSYTGYCPSVMLRNRKSMFGDNNPAVYVDGARAANTCVLDELSPADVSRVEVYPQGIGPGGSYESHANGLILVFMRTGQT